MSEPHPVGNRKTRRSWDKIVADARDVFYDLPVVDDETFRVYVPDVDRLTAMFQKRGEGDIYGALAVLIGNGEDGLGEKRVERLREVAKAAAGEDGRVPISAWRDLLQEELMPGLGLGGPGERSPER